MNNDNLDNKMKAMPQLSDRYTPEHQTFFTSRTIRINALLIPIYNNHGSQYI